MINFLFETNAFALVVKLDQLLEVLVAAVIFVIIGLVVFGIAYFVLHLIMPFSIRKEIEEDHNPAIALVIGGVIIGLAIIIAAAIKG